MPPGIPPPVAKAFDGLRRAFLWAAVERLSGAQCLVAWDAVCRPKAEGGLGIKSLKDQNRCLLVKLLHRLHAGDESPWARWVWQMVGDRPLSGLTSRRLPGAHWGSLCVLVPLYRSVSQVCVGNGERCAFWLDPWLPSGPICSGMPALFTHALDDDESVASVLRRGLRAAVQPRLTPMAESQMVRLAGMLAEVRLAANNDTRALTRCATKDGRLHTSALYKLTCHGRVVAPFASFIWGSRAPSRVQFFGWLLSLGRIQTRDALLRKTILTAEECGCPLCPAALETANHLVFECPFARNFWASIGACDMSASDVRALHLVPPPPGVPPRSLPTFLLLCCWQLWKHRNGVIFNGDTPSLATLRGRCRDDAALWKHRLPASQQEDAAAWLERFAV